MESNDFAGRPVSRRAALTLGGGVIAATALGSDSARATNRKARASSGGTLPVERIEDIVQAKGAVSDGVLSIGIERTDIGHVTLRGVPIKPAFEISGDLSFQPIGPNRAFFNGDVALKPSEVNPVIDAILASGLVFQAEHQHFYDFEPEVWFIHFRGKGDPIALARAVHHVLKATSTPLPQEPPAHPTTPLDTDRLQRILHGYDAEVGDDGVVTVFVSRRDAISIDGVTVKPQANIATNVAFQPLGGKGGSAAVAPDFAMEAPEITGLMRVMRARGWDIGCLYNQETDEHPQLFFSHQFKTGNAYDLAREVRLGLDQTNSH